MAVEVDKVIVELEARLGRYEGRLREAERRWGATTQGIGRSANQMEQTISRSTGAIGNQLRTLAAAFAAAFTAQRVTQLADTYTRFTNQLAVAGLEGENLARVQQQLFEVAQRNGVEMESLANLYGRVTQSAGDLGASQAEILQLTEGVAAGLRVQGASASQASGAILGLVQALGSTTVKAEEFNQINEGAPALLRGVAQNIDAAGGSISRLRALVVAGSVTNQEFFRAFLAGSEELEQQAARSTLTIANSFTVLNNALGMYIGQTDDSLSATERISQAIILLANNLDKVTAALGILAAVMLGRFVAGMTAAAATTGVVSTAIFAMQARAAAAATTMEALALTSATAGRAMLAAFGGPVGLAVTALAVGIYYLSGAVDDAALASEEYLEQQRKLEQIQGRVAEATDTLATATGRAREEALANARAIQQEARQYLFLASAALLAAQVKSGIAAREAATVRFSSGAAVASGGSAMAVGGNFAGRRTDAAERQAQANLRIAQENEAAARRELQRIEGVLDSAPPVRNVAPSAAGRTRRDRGRQGPDAEDITRRFLDDLDRLQSEQLQAQLQVTRGAEDRAQLMRDLAAREYAARLRDIEASEDYTEARKAALREELSRLYGIGPDGTIFSDSPISQGINREEAEQLAREELEVRQIALDAELDALDQQEQLADTQAERREIQNQILDAEIERLRLELDSLQAWQVHERAIAQARLDSAVAMRGGNREIIRRDTAGPGESFLEQLRRDGAALNESMERVAVDGLQALNDGLTDAIMGTKSLGAAFKEVANQIIGDLLRIAIRQAIIGPIAEALFGGGLPGFATGGSGIIGGRGGTDRNVLSLNGQPFARVSRGERLTVTPQGKALQPVGGNAQMLRPQVTVISAPSFDLRNMVGTPELFREVERVSRANAAQAGAAAAQGALKAVPARMGQFSRDGR